MKIKHLLSILFIIFCSTIFFTTINIYSQEKTDFDTNFIIGEWVLNSKNLNIKQDTLEYIPYNSPLTTELHPVLKYGGIRFEWNGVFVQHIFQKCGTGNPPASFKGNWTISTEKETHLLTTIVYDDKIIKKMYYIYSISADRLILIIANK